MGIYYVIIGLAMGASWLAGNMLKRKFKKYSQVGLKSNMSGAEVAEKMLADAGITDVTVMAVAMVNLGGKMSTFVIMAGFGLMAAQSVLGAGVALFGAALFGLTTLFAFVTLPVEFDASKRALAYVTNSGIVTSQESVQAKDALKWAAMTYVVAALASLAQLAYWLFFLL